MGSTVTWSDGLLTGHEALDAQHREIYGVCDRLGEAVAAREFPDASDLRFLERYIEEHFAHEETLMREVQYPRLDAHAREHRAYAATLARLLRQSMSERDMVGEVTASVTSWFGSHILHQDVALAAFVAAARKRHSVAP